MTTRAYLAGLASGIGIMLLACCCLGWWARAEARRQWREAQRTRFERRGRVGA